MARKRSTEERMAELSEGIQRLYDDIHSLRARVKRLEEWASSTSQWAEGFEGSVHAAWVEIDTLRDGEKLADMAKEIEGEIGVE